MIWPTSISLISQKNKTTIFIQHNKSIRFVFWNYWKYIAQNHIQMKRIEIMDISKFNPIVINTFDDKGNFLDKDTICKKILDFVTG